MSLSRSTVARVARVAALGALASVTAGCPAPPPPRPVAPPPPPTDDAVLAPAPPAPERLPPEAGVVKLGPVMMTGGMGMSSGAREQSKSAFIASFEAGTSPFRRCYGAALARNPALAGSFDIEVVIARDGSVYELKPGTVELDDAELVRCAVRALRELGYAPLSDGEYFSITPVLQFKPE